MSKSDEKLDPRVKRTRKLLQNAFIELLQEKSFTAMTVQDIAECAGINRATFYAHYTDKFELHDEVLVQFFRQQLKHYQLSIGSEFCKPNIRSLIFAVCDFHTMLNTTCHITDVQYKPDIENLIQSEIYSIVYQWVQELEGMDKPDIASATISWAIYGAGAQWHRQQKHSKDEIADTVIALIGDGLRSQVTNLPELANTQ